MDVCNAFTFIYMALCLKISQKQCKISIFLRTENFCKYLSTRFCFSKLLKTEYSEEVHGSLLK